MVALSHFYVLPPPLPLLLLLLLLPPLQQGSCADHDDKQANYDPLSGSTRRYPGPGGWAFQGSPELTRLLDVGACINNSDMLISYVPPLDGTDPHETLCQQDYAMQFVLFDLQLVELKAVDPVGGSFRAQIQMIFHWIDRLDDGSNMRNTSNCSFLCDDNPQAKLCCDDVWVPPLRLPRCNVEGIQSSTPMPYLHYNYGEIPFSFNDCINSTNKDIYGKCFWRRLWYLNIDATCSSQMDFQSFPFDVQSLTIDIFNPYASRTWFQLTKGFLKQNVGEGINSVKLSPDSKIPGWYVKNFAISSTCGITQTWQQTFLTQDTLLSSALQDLTQGYESQKEEIIDALSIEQLKCVSMEDILKNNKDMASPLDTSLYWTVLDKYSERVNSTLEEYTKCVQENGKDFAWNETIYHKPYSMKINDNFGSDFSTTEENINRSFSAFNILQSQPTNKIWFPCAIKAISNLTTPGIRVTILVQRYKMFYVVKLILPTVACVAFSFMAFGLEPKELLGRLGVVVPSAIALTALQGFVVASDMPPVAYIAPSTYIVLISYFFQLLIGYESVIVKWMCTRQRVRWIWMETRSSSYSTSTRVFSRLNKSEEDYTHKWSATRIFDLVFMCVIAVLYILSILLCTFLPYSRSENLKSQTEHGSVNIWPNPPQ